MNNKNAREFALDVIYEIFQNDAYSNITLNKIFKNNDIDETDKKYITEIVYGTIKNKIYLEYILKSYTKGRVKAKIKYLLILSLYQILKMDKTPNFAVVNEAVIIAKKIGGPNAGRFVNGVLRNFIRTFDDNSLVYKTEKEKILIEQSCPEELFDILQKQYGFEKSVNIIMSFFEKSTNSVRVNFKKNNKEELLTKLSCNNMDSRSSDICEDCIILDNLNLNSSLFLDGSYIVQDEASALVALSLNENYEKKLNILDVCAAPGGKSLHLATRYFNSIVTSCDKYIHKLELLNSNAKRLGITNIKIIQQDATEQNVNFINNFDVVVCDVPCSGIGVIKNKPEIKYKINNEYIKDIVNLQYSILENSKKYVKDNGLLLYSTCTIDKRENIFNIEKFLKNNKDFKLEKIHINSIINEENDGIINILPDEYNCDGFFIAKLRKVVNL